jgi:putative addiction module killer protein
MDVEHYCGLDGRDTFAEWLGSVTDQRAQAAVAMRIGRLRRGLLGDWRPCRAGVAEMRIDVGPGYRVYLARLPPDRILLICGGTKRTQRSDIDRAVQLLHDFKERRR